MVFQVLRVVGEFDNEDIAKEHLNNMTSKFQDEFVIREVKE